MKCLSRLSTNLLLLIALVCLTACPAPYDPGFHHPDNTMIGEITKIVGTGEVRINNRIVQEGAVMQSGDHIATVGDARTTLKLARGGEVLFAADTDPILQWVSAAFCKLRILINVGSILVDTPCVTEAETGSGAVINTLGTTFHLTVTSAWTELTVIKGKMAIRSNVGNWQIVSAGYQCRVLRNRQAPPPVLVDTRSVHDWACRLDRRLCREGSPQQGDVPVPNVLGTELEQAQQILSRNSLKLGRVRETATMQRFDDGRVFAQSPPHGAWVPVNAEVDLSVWRYRALAPVMPLLVNRPIEEAEAVLKESGIRLGRIGVLPTRDPGQNGRVARQSPGAGLRIQPDTVAMLTVYRYERPPVPTVNVPDLLGMHIDKARAELERAGLTVGRVVAEPTPSSRQIGLVFRQQPNAGTEMKRGSSVNVWIYQQRILQRPGVLHLQPVE